MKRIACTLVGALLAADCYATGCSRIEYADARDWPVEKAEADYCRSAKFGAINRDLLRDLRAQGLLNASDSNHITADVSSCLERQALFARVIENVHKRPLPACK